MNETRGILMNLESRFQTFSQQQLIFVTALDRCRKTAFEPTRQISTIAQVYNYAEQVSDNATDKRIFNIFLALVRDLAEFRRSLSQLSKQQSDEKLNNTFSTWKRILESRQDISRLRARFPYCHVNHLSCDEAKNHFGGIVSVLPVAMECARDAVERIEIIRAYRKIANKATEEGFSSDVPSSCRARQGSQSARFPDSCVKNNLEKKAPECCLDQSTSPVVSSPLSSNTVSEVSLQSAKSATALSKPNEITKQEKRPSSAYLEQASMAQKLCKNQVDRPKTGVATQTPNYLAATLKPALNWPHKTISESEMRKMLKQRKHGLNRPEWKP